MSYLRWLEAESIHIFREVAAEARRPVMMYSIGKDSSVMLHLAKKAFFPGRVPFPLLHVDTMWKFNEMYKFRDQVANTDGINLIVHKNPEALKQNINPFDHGSTHTYKWKTEGLKQALDAHGFDAAFGGARRDEEKSRAKERIVSLRSATHRWDPKKQRPEIGSIYNIRKNDGETLRIYPLSNWTEIDVWQYILEEEIEIVPLYFSAPRRTVERENLLLMVDDERFPLKKGEIPKIRNVRFRTLGCYPLTGAMLSKAKTLPEIIKEITQIGTSERQGRTIDQEESSSMEMKKQEGYF